MSNSREIILSNIKKALNTTSQIPNLYAHSEQQLIKDVVSNRPKAKDELWKRFREEFQAVSGEFRPFENSDNIAEHITGFLRKNNHKQLVISGDQICQKVAEKIKTMDSGIEIAQATSFLGEERKARRNSSISGGGLLRCS